MPSCKWDSAYEWFEEYIDGLSLNEAIAIAKELAQKVGNDEIQDMFQSKMEEDGFFRKEHSLEEFIAKLEAGIKEMDSYKEDIAFDYDIKSPSDWIKSTWKASFESLYQDYDGDADEAIAYLGG